MKTIHWILEPDGWTGLDEDEYENYLERKDDGTDREAQEQEG